MPFHFVAYGNGVYSPNRVTEIASMHPDSRVIIDDHVTSDADAEVLALYSELKTRKLHSGANGGIASFYLSNPIKSITNYVTASGKKEQQGCMSLTLREYQQKIHSDTSQDVVDVKGIEIIETNLANRQLYPDHTFPYPPVMKRAFLDEGRHIQSLAEKAEGEYIKVYQKHLFIDSKQAHLYQSLKESIYNALYVEKGLGDRRTDANVSDVLLANALTSEWVKYENNIQQLFIKQPHLVELFDEASKKTLIPLEAFVLKGFDGEILDEPFGINIHRSVELILEDEALIHFPQLLAEMSASIFLDRLYIAYLQKKLSENAFATEENRLGLLQDLLLFLEKPIKATTVNFEELEMFHIARDDCYNRLQKIQQGSDLLDNRTLLFATRTIEGLLQQSCQFLKNATTHLSNRREQILFNHAKKMLNSEESLDWLNKLHKTLRLMQGDELSGEIDTTEYGTSPSAVNELFVSASNSFLVFFQTIFIPEYKKITDNPNSTIEKLQEFLKQVKKEYKKQSTLVQQLFKENLFPLLELMNIIQGQARFTYNIENASKEQEKDIVQYYELSYAQEYMKINAEILQQAYTLIENFREYQKDTDFARMRISSSSTCSTELSSDELFIYHIFNGKNSDKQKIARKILNDFLYFKGELEQKKIEKIQHLESFGIENSSVVIERIHNKLCANLAFQMLSHPNRYQYTDILSHIRHNNDLFERVFLLLDNLNEYQNKTGRDSFAKRDSDSIISDTKLDAESKSLKGFLGSDISEETSEVSEIDEDTYCLKSSEISEFDFLETVFDVSNHKKQKRAEKVVNNFFEFHQQLIAVKTQKMALLDEKNQEFVDLIDKTLCANLAYLMMEHPERYQKISIDYFLLISVLCTLFNNRKIFSDDARSVFNTFLKNALTTMQSEKVVALFYYGLLWHEISRAIKSSIFLPVSSELDLVLTELTLLRNRLEHDLSDDKNNFSLSGLNRSLNPSKKSFDFTFSLFGESSKPVRILPANVKQVVKKIKQTESTRLNEQIADALDLLRHPSSSR